nr:forkhead box J1 [Hofstenia miamia]
MLTRGCSVPANMYSSQDQDLPNWTFPGVESDEEPKLRNEESCLDDSLTSLNWLQELHGLKLAQPNNAIASSANCSFPLPNHTQQPFSFERNTPHIFSRPTNAHKRSFHWNDGRSCKTSKRLPGQWLNAATILNDPDLNKFASNARLKPSYSYATLICMALKARQDSNEVALSQIYDWILENFAYFRYAESTWQNSIRHNLSVNKCFDKVRKRGESGNKGSVWRINPVHEAQINSMFKRKKPSSQSYKRPKLTQYLRSSRHDFDQRGPPMRYHSMQDSHSMRLLYSNSDDLEDAISREDDALIAAAEAAEQSNCDMENLSAIDELLQDIAPRLSPQQDMMHSSFNQYEDLSIRGTHIPPPLDWEINNPDWNQHIEWSDSYSQSRVTVESLEPITTWAQHRSDDWLNSSHERLMSTSQISEDSGYIPSDESPGNGCSSQPNTHCSEINGLFNLEDLPEPLA